MKNQIDSIESTCINFKEVIQDLLGLTTICEDRKWNRSLAIVGLVDCLPLAHIKDSEILALRVNPSSSSLDIVVADIIAGESMIIASDMAYFIPIWITSSLFNVDSSKWDKWQRGGSVKWKELAKLHEHFGGKDGLNNMKSFIKSSKFKNSFSVDLDSIFDKYELLPEAFKLILPNSKRSLFQYIVYEIENNLWIENIDKYEIGNWHKPLNLVLGAVANPNNDKYRFKLALEACKIPNAHDASWLRFTGVKNFSGLADHKYGAPRLTASNVIDYQPPSWESEWKAAITGLLESEKYTGEGHLVSFELLQKAGKYEEAWNAMLSFCFWQQKAYGKVNIEFLLLLNKLAHDYFPDTLYPVVGRNIQYLMDLGIE